MIDQRLEKIKQISAADLGTRRKFLAKSTISAPIILTAPGSARPKSFGFSLISLSAPPGGKEKILPFTGAMIRC